jgi:hypothetical protein
MRRIICDYVNISFYDKRAEIQCKYGQEPLFFNDLPFGIRDSYEIVKEITNTSENILLEIFITSLCHTLRFGGIPNENKVNDIIYLLRNTENILVNFLEPLKQLCLDILDNQKDNILLNPSLGFSIPLLNNRNIPADCDFVVNDILYDIKCTIGDNIIYEFLQLLGYASLLHCVPEYNRKINNMCIINLLQGSIINYDISFITTDQILHFLHILHPENNIK